MPRYARFVLPVLVTAAIGLTALADMPDSFDLRSAGPGGTSYVTSVKNQGQCGSCWCFGTMASIESHMLMHGGWRHDGQPDFSENHLNHHHNFDPIPPCMGGDYRMTSAYFSRGSGPVLESDAPYNYNTAPPEDLPVHYLVRDILWLNAHEDLSNIGEVKDIIMTRGAIGTSIYWSSGVYNGSKDSLYQPPSNGNDPNHSVTVVGWDDDRLTQAPEPGAWLCKNSWGASWSGDGYFWVSYHDKHAAKNPEMGAVSFQNVSRAFQHTTYAHDDHGWCAEEPYRHAVNAFTASGDEALAAVSFYTTADDVDATVRVYDRFENGELLDLRTETTTSAAHTGLHTIDLPELVPLTEGDDFFIELELTAGGLAIDCTVEKTVLMNEEVGGYVVVSEAGPGESFVSTDGASWDDLYEVYADRSANACIKGLSILRGDFNLDGAVNGLDIPAFKEALADPDGWKTASGLRADWFGDFTLDGAMNGLDIPGFKSRLEGSAVPEPTAIVPAVLVLLGLRRRR